MGQVYYTIEKLDGGMYRALTAAEAGEEEDGSGGEPEYETEQAAFEAVKGLRAGKGAKGAKGKGGKEGEAVVAPGGSYRVVQKLRLPSGIIGAPSAPGALDPPVVATDPERAKKARDERRKEEDAQYERTGFVPNAPRDVPRREVSGSPLSMSREDRITSTADPGAKVGMAARAKAGSGGSNSSSGKA